MKRTINSLIMAGTVVLSACQTQKSDTGEIIGKSSPKIENGIMTPEVMMSLGRVGGVELSPDKQKILYGVTYVSIPENKSNRELFVMNIDGSDRKQITRTPKCCMDTEWSKNSIFVNGERKLTALGNECGWQPTRSDK